MNNYEKWRHRAMMAGMLLLGMAVVLGGVSITWMFLMKVMGWIL